MIDRERLLARERHPASRACTTWRTAWPQPPRRPPAASRERRWRRVCGPSGASRTGLKQAGMVAGVTYVNDSKATNVEATLTALNAYPESTHLILGGRDKASDYRPVARACARGCKAVYLIGEATPLIAAAFAEVAAGGEVDRLPEVVSVGDLERAVEAAAQERCSRRCGAAGSGLCELRPIQELRRAGRALQEPLVRAPYRGRAVVTAHHRAQTSTVRPRPRRVEATRAARPRARRPTLGRLKERLPIRLPSGLGHHCSSC